MRENLPSNGRAAASCMIAAMFVVGCIDNFIVFIAETVSIWQFQALRAAIALPLILGLSAFGAGSILPKRFWAFYFAHFRIADHRIGVGGKDRTDTRDCGFFGLFGYFIGAQ